MSKYFDKLVKMDENLSKKLNEVTDDNTVIVGEEEKKDTVSVDVSKLTPAQKEDILKDRGVDPELTKGMTPEEMDGVLKISDTEKKNESGSSSVIDSDVQSPSFCIAINDDDLGLNGYVSCTNGEKKKFDISDSTESAMKFYSIEEANEEIDDICKQCHYDPSTIHVVELDEDDLVKDEDNWISLNPLNPSATTLGGSQF